MGHDLHNDISGKLNGSPSRSTANHTSRGLSISPPQSQVLLKKEPDSLADEPMVGELPAQMKVRDTPGRFVVHRQPEEDTFTQKKAFQFAKIVPAHQDVVQRVVWEYNGTNWVPNDLSAIGKKVNWPENPKEGDTYDDDLESATVPDLPGTPERTVRLHTEPEETNKNVDERKGSEPDEAQVPEIATVPIVHGVKSIMIAPESKVDDIKYSGPQIDASQMDRPELKKWLDVAIKALDKLEKYNSGDAFYSLHGKEIIDRKNKLKTEIKSVQDFLDNENLRRRSPADIELAKAFVGRELVKEGVGGWLGLDEVAYEKMVQHIKDIIDDPVKISQGAYPICGPDTLLRNIAIYKPKEYAVYMVSLVRDAKGQIGEKKFELPESVKAKKYKDKETLHKINPADLLAQSAIRAADNTRAYNKIRTAKGSFVKRWHAGISGLTTIDQMVKWVKEIGVPDDKISSGSYMFTSNSSRGVLDTINDRFNAGHAVMLLINPAIMDHDTQTEVSRAKLERHIVTLSSPFEAEGTNWSASSQTWGTVKKLSFRDSEISKSILGFAAVDFSSLPDRDLPEEESRITAMD